MRIGIFTWLFLSAMGLSVSARGEGGTPPKILEYRTQMIYPEGRVDLRIEMQVANGANDFEDEILVFIKNEESTDWILMHAQDQVRFAKVAYTQDLTPEIRVRETVQLSSHGDRPRLTKNDLGIHYFDASLKRFQFEYSGLRDLIQRDFPGVVEPRSGKPIRLVERKPRIVDGSYEFTYELNGETASLTRSDGKKVSFPRRGLGMRPEFTIDDGILTLDGSPRRFDLRMFDAEVSFIGDTEESVWVKNAEGQFVDPVDEADQLYPDLVAKERQRLGSARVAGLDEEVSESMSKIARALKLRRSVKLLGPAGSGKSTEVEVLARLVAQGRVPQIPRTAQIRTLSLNTLAAGTKYVGELETRMAVLLEMAKKLKSILLIDEFHAAVGVGVSSGNPTNIAQTLKPALESGELRMIGISTRQEWEHAFASDAAFDQRFEEVAIDAPRGPELLRKIRNSLVLKGLPLPEDAAIQRAIDLSDRYAITGAQPRKAIGLLLKAAVLMEERTGGGAGADLPAVERAAAEAYRIDPATFQPSVVFERLTGMKGVLSSQVVGQKEAVEKISQIWFRKLTQVGSDQSAKAILFYGPPGTGKTLTARLSAQAGGYVSRAIEMNKYANGDIEAFRYEVFLALRESPNTVLILDEFEKAHPRVQNSVLSMMQPGSFTVNFQDASGRRVFEEVNSSNAIFCLTSNAGQSLFERGATRPQVGYRPSLMHLPEGAPVALASDEVVATLVRDGISEPVLSRLEAVVGLRRPLDEEFRTALAREIDATLARESTRRGVTFVLGNREALVDHLMEEFHPGRSDYREVGHLVRENLDPLIGQAIIDPRFPSTARVRIDWSPGIDVSELPTAKECAFLLLKPQRPLRSLGR